MRILFAGTPEFAVPSLHALVAAGHEIVGVVTREDAPLGRKRTMTPSPVAQVADELGLPVLRTNVLDAAATEWCANYEPDLGVIVAYGGLVKEPLLSLPHLGWINLHFSELPRWRGAAPVQRALAAGEQQIGVTVFRLVPALDAGDILVSRSFDFAPGTSAGEVLKSLSEQGTDTVVSAVQLLQDDRDAGVPQIGTPSYAHKLTREDGRLNLSEPAERVLAHWAGMTPEPGAYVMHHDSVLKVLEARLYAASPTLTDTLAEQRMPGATRLIAGVAVLEVGSGALELVRVQPAGKAAMDGAAWLRGREGETELS